MTLPEKCLPASSASFNTSCLVFSWATMENGINVDIYFDRNYSNLGEWAGIGFSKTSGMKDSDIYICKALNDTNDTSNSQNLTLTSAYSAAEAPPTEYPWTSGTTPGIVGNASTAIDNLGFRCTFVVNQTVTKEKQEFVYSKLGEKVFKPLKYKF